MLHTRLNLQVALTRRTSGRNVRTFKINLVSEVGEQGVEKHFRLFFLISEVFSALSTGFSYSNQPTVLIFYVITGSKDEFYRLLECDVI